MKRHIRWWIVGVISSIMTMSSMVNGIVVPRREPLPPNEPHIFYVDRAWGDDTYDGLTPEWPFATIQTAIDTARDGDRVFVYEGIYQESLDMQGKAITIKGIAGPLGVPILKATDISAVQMLSGEGPEAKLQNLVISESLIGICLLDSNPTLQNLTVVKCGIGVLGLGESDPNINSCILWYNESGDVAGVTARYSCIERLDDAFRLYNISADPLFVDPENHDYRLKTTYGRYEPALDQWIYDEVNSPCVSAGDPAIDYRLEPYPNGERINIGAFGNTVYASMGPGLKVDIRLISWQVSQSGITEFTIEAPAEVTSSNREVERVEFYLDGVLVGQDSSSRDGWVAQLSVNVEVGVIQPFELIAVAVDIFGNRGLSEPRIIEIDNRPIR